MRIALIFSIFNLSLTCYAQFTLNYFHLPHPGDSLKNWFYLDTTSINPGPSGSNIIWDFSNVTPIDTTTINNIYSVVSSSLCFPQPVNMSIYTDLGTSYYSRSYYLSDSNGYGWQGTCHYDSYGYSETSFNDRNYSIRTPLDYLEEKIDSTTGQMYDAFAGINGQKTIITKNKYDGFGILNLPWGSYSNVARIKTDYYLKDTALGGWNYKTIQHITEYSWYDNNVSNPVLYYSTQIDSNYGAAGSLSGVTKRINFISQINNTINISEFTLKDNTVKVFPIPINSVLNILLENCLSNYFIEIHKITGETVFTSNINEITNQINTTTFNNGVYILTIRNSDHMYAKKLVIQH